MKKVQKLLVEGNIGAGKSTFCANLKSLQINFQKSLFVLPELIDATFLKLFYSNVSKYAFAFQMHMLEHRTNVNELCVLNLDHVKYDFALLDRSIFGDCVFAIVNYLTASISEEEFAVYTNICGLEEIHKIGFLLDEMYGKSMWNFVYLHSSFSECKNRVDTVRKSVETENNVPQWYYECIEQVYFFLFVCLNQTHPYNVSVYAWHQYAEDVKKTCKKVLRVNGYSNQSENFARSTKLSESTEDFKQIPEQVCKKRLKNLKIPWTSREWREIVLKMFVDLH